MLISQFFLDNCETNQLKHFHIIIAKKYFDFMAYILFEFNNFN